MNLCVVMNEVVLCCVMCCVCLRVGHQPITSRETHTTTQWHEEQDGTPTGSVFKNEGKTSIRCPLVERKVAEIQVYQPYIYIYRYIYVLSISII